jgi:hypothetical protein
MKPTQVTTEIEILKSYILQLLQKPSCPFDAHLRSNLPTLHGIYRIFDPKIPSETVRAGRTKSAQGGLRQRIYQNHLMGNQFGNLPAQLVKAGTCPDLRTAKQYIQGNFQVQFLILPDDKFRARAEYFMLSILNPKFFDRDE